MTFEFEERLAARAVPKVGDKITYYRNDSPTPNATATITKIDGSLIHIKWVIGRVGRGRRSITKTDIIKSSQIARITHKLGEY